MEHSTWKGTILKTKRIVFQPSVFKKYVSFQGGGKVSILLFSKTVAVGEVDQVCPVSFRNPARWFSQRRIENFGAKIWHKTEVGENKHKGSPVCWI